MRVFCPSDIGILKIGKRFIEVHWSGFSCLLEENNFFFLRFFFGEDFTEF